MTSNTIPSPGGFTNSRNVRIEWGDCDPAGIVFFPRYFAFFDASTAAIFEEVGLPKPALLKKYEIVGFPVVDVGAKFFVPSRFGDDVTIETTIAEWRRSSFRVQHRLLRGATLAIEAFEVRVWVGKHPDDPEAIKSRPIPQELIDRFTLR
jgi:4-hydroxybenzoyl-CoA thioesterase